MNRYHINLFWSEPDACWVADVPDLKSCSAFGDTPAEALAEVEEAIAAWLGVEDVVGVSSGTAALHLGVRALGWGSGDEVVTSPLSFVASANEVTFLTSWSCFSANARWVSGVR